MFRDCRSLLSARFSVSTIYTYIHTEFYVRSKEESNITMNDLSSNFVGLNLKRNIGSFRRNTVKKPNFVAQSQKQLKQTVKLKRNQKMVTEHLPDKERSSHASLKNNCIRCIHLN